MNASGSSTIFRSISSECAQYSPSSMRSSKVYFTEHTRRLVTTPASSTANNPLRYTDPTGLCSTTYDCCVERATQMGIDPDEACGDLPKDMSKKAMCIHLATNKHEADDIACACLPGKVRMKICYTKSMAVYGNNLLECAKLGWQ